MQLQVLKTGSRNGPNLYRKKVSPILFEADILRKSLKSPLKDRFAQVRLESSIKRTFQPLAVFPLVGKLMPKPATQDRSKEWRPGSLPTRWETDA